MPAYKTGTCREQCSLSRVLWEVALGAANMPLEDRWEAWFRFANAIAHLETKRLLGHTVWGSKEDICPGTLYDKVEAGSNIAIVAQAPAGVIGYGTKERIVRISSTTGAHTILDGDKHSDSVAQGATRGSLMYGNDSDKWDEKPIGSATHVFTSDGTDCDWAPNVDTDIATVGADLGVPGTAISTLDIVGGTGISTAVAEAPAGTATVTITNDLPNTDTKISYVQADVGAQGTDITTLVVAGGSGIGTAVVEDPAGTATVTVTNDSPNTDTMITNVQADAGAGGTNITTLDITGGSGLATSVSEAPAGTGTVTVAHAIGGEDYSWLVGVGDVVSIDTDGHIRSVKGWTA